jgi:2,4-dienoyl-CoA reductase-like NADH-dependent reductase (Old Yellow Enzyme family)
MSFLRAPEAGDTGAAGPSSPAPGAVPALFTPFQVRRVSFRNRVVVTPMCQYCATDGHAVTWHFSHHGRFALGGVGGALVEASGVTREGRITHGCLGIYRDSHVEGLRRIVSIYHDQQIPVGIQLAHSGRKGSAAVPLDGAAPLARHDPARAWEIVAPSAIPMTPDWPVPRALDERGIGEIIAAFAAAARRAVAAGFDFVEIHGAHGYLVHSFLSPLANRREDAWGGSLENRMRLAVSVAQAIRESIPDDMPLFYRTSAVDGIEGGVTVADNVALAARLKTCGVDVIDCSSGGITGPSGRAHQPPAPGYLVPYAREIRREAGIPTMAVGLIIEPQQANEVIASGSADLVALGRQLLEDPNFVLHAARALGHPQPFSVLPKSYAFFLERRRIT